MLHQIGAGVLGPVFRTHDEASDRLVAVKVFRLDITPEQARSLAEEFDRLAKLDLDHPAIVMPLAGGVEGTVAYLAQQYIAGDSVDVAYRHASPSLAELVQFVGALASAVDFAAFAGARHGALHPRDILVTGDRLHVTGFGVAQALERIGLKSPARRPYSAPERLAGAEWGRGADVFAVAAVTYELLFNRRLPGDPSHASEAASAIDGERAALAPVFVRALAPDPAARFPTVLAFAEAFTETVLDLHGPSASTSKAATAVPASEIDIGESPTRAMPPPDDAREFELDLQPGWVPSEFGNAPPSARLSDESGPDAGHTRTRDWTSEEGTAAALPAVVDRDPPAPTPSEDASDQTVSEEETKTLPWAPPDAAELVGVVASTATESARPLWPLIVVFLAGIGIGSVSGYLLASATSPVESTSPSASNSLTRPAEPGIQGTTGPATAETKAPTTVASSAKAPSAKTPSTRTASAKIATSKTTTAPRTANAKPAPASSATTASAATTVATANGKAKTPAATTTTAKSTSKTAAQSTAATQPTFAGFLTVISKPAGASVFIDGRDVGKTPLALGTVTAGSHVVRLELAGYRRWSSSVRVVAGQKERVTASLEVTGTR